MEIGTPTFMWLREFGCVTTSHAVPGRMKGMLSLTTEGLITLQQGKSIVRLLHHYCCHRFETPEQLIPMDGDSVAVKRHNWGIVSKILNDALEFELSWERRELIIANDVIEIMVLLKQIHELVKPHRALDRELKEKHKHVHDNPHNVEVKERLVKPLSDDTKSAASPQRKQVDKPWVKNSVRDPRIAGSSPSPVKRNR